MFIDGRYNTGIRRIRVLLVIALVLAGRALCADGADSRFERTVSALQSAPPAWRADFARIALSQLVAAYLVEADLARSDTGGDRLRQLHWSRSVQQYVTGLQRVLWEIAEGRPPALRVSQVSEPIVEVAGQEVMLSHPRPRQQAALEQQVLTDFCRQHDCNRLLPTKARASRGAGHTQVKPTWAFTADGPACSFSGLQLRFQPGTDAGALRRLCTEVFAESKRLVSRIRRQQDYGVAVDWYSVELREVHDRSGQMLVQLNNVGDSVLARLPALYRRPHLFHSLQPWLAGRVAHSEPTLTLRVDNLGESGEHVIRIQSAVSVR